MAKSGAPGLFILSKASYFQFIIDYIDIFVWKSGTNAHNDGVKQAIKRMIYQKIGLFPGDNIFKFQGGYAVI